MESWGGQLTFVQQLEAASYKHKCVNTLLWIIFGFGVLKLTLFLLRSLALIADLFILPPVNFSKYGSKAGTYAVVTGASDGIGKEYARQLGKRGFNLILISRTLGKLEDLQAEIQKNCNVKVEILALDFSTDEPSNYEKIKELCKRFPVSILVNNVGRSHSIPVPFLETEEEEMRNIITINNTATLMVTQVVAPIIVNTVKEKKSPRGLILTMGSFGGLIPTPLLATYSGSKAFLQNWSNSLAGELAKDNVDVEVILSYLVTSAMSKVRRTSMMIPNPKQFVASTLRNVGRRCGAQERYATSTPYWSHAIYEFLIEEVFGVYAKAVNSINYSFHKSIRARALKKAERLAKQQ